MKRPQVNWSERAHLRPRSASLPEARNQMIAEAVDHLMQGDFRWLNQLIAGGCFSTAGVPGFYATPVAVCPLFDPFERVGQPIQDHEQRQAFLDAGMVMDTEMHAAWVAAGQRVTIILSPSSIEQYVDGTAVSAHYPNPTQLAMAMSRVQALRDAAHVRSTDEELNGVLWINDRKVKAALAKTSSPE